jgi:hypothetical protein
MEKNLQANAEMGECGSSPRKGGIQVVKGLLSIPPHGVQNGPDIAL